MFRTSQIIYLVVVFFLMRHFKVFNKIDKKSAKSKNKTYVFAFKFAALYVGAQLLEIMIHAILDRFPMLPRLPSFMYDTVEGHTPCNNIYSTSEGHPVYVEVQSDGLGGAGVVYSDLMANGEPLDATTAVFTQADLALLDSSFPEADLGEIGDRVYVNVPDGDNWCLQTSGMHTDQATDGTLKTRCLCEPSPDVSLEGTIVMDASLPDPTAISSAEAELVGGETARAAADPPHQKVSLTIDGSTEFHVIPGGLANLWTPWAGVQCSSDQLAGGTCAGEQWRATLPSSTLDNDGAPIVPDSTAAAADAVGFAGTGDNACCPPQTIRNNRILQAGHWLQHGSGSGLSAPGADDHLGMTTLTSAESGCYVKYGGRLYGYGGNGGVRAEPQTLIPLGDAAGSWQQDSWGGARADADNGIKVTNAANEAACEVGDASSEPGMVTGAEYEWVQIPTNWQTRAGQELTRRQGLNLQDQWEGGLGVIGTGADSYWLGAAAATAAGCSGTGAAVTAADETCTENTCAGYTPGTDPSAPGTGCPAGCTLAGTAGTDETCTPTIADCSAGYTAGDATTPSTTCNTTGGCILTNAVAAEDIANCPDLEQDACVAHTNCSYSAR